MPLEPKSQPHLGRCRAPAATVTAENKYPQADQHYHRHEWQVGQWRLELALPRPVDPARARATLRYGVLVVMAPISEQGAGESRPTVS
ncbi:MAG TPA: Hsp20/alpha crystallin family protein [Candidatus Dormibacteraeota bacterium]